MAAKDYDHLFKLLIIGDSGVGKSSLLVRYVVSIFLFIYHAQPYFQKSVCVNKLGRCENMAQNVAFSAFFLLMILTATSAATLALRFTAQ